MSYTLLSPTKEHHDFGNGVHAYRYCGMVTIVGSITISSSNLHPTIGTLPAGWRPGYYVAADCLIPVTQSADVPPYVDVLTDGRVTVESRGYVGTAFVNVTAATA
ncbi:hypothetical protein AAY81_00980 [Denitrobacterium detoxificans]|uniref:Uncharacterized protein n=1 Tax=Denitrobacterium detoxificans TaxID=79604 RepID=A0A172RW61_9ACTN|nr:hypothetical protein [Denitrobacterium detoxificans]ANE21971.1 hypothetical protein AAY81_00980 [Denitrobacterium detoxificans]SEO97699.1 hypothetical protein SAMN02910314_01792 [Denitrobacterium detoxificans]